MRKPDPTNTRAILLLPLLGLAILLGSFCRPLIAATQQSFTLAVIPDTQNYIDFRHQTAAGFEFDASTLFIEQMRYIAANSVSNGGDIAFVAAVGDVWQHQSKLIDAAHQLRGIGLEPDPVLARNAVRSEQVSAIELPRATEGYRIISRAGLPFGVAPGNHDYDAAWSVAGYPPNRVRAYSELERKVEDLGILHVGGLDNFRRVFGDDSEFFRDRPWYIASHDGGANSAQRFSAAGYDFLHIALEMQPGDDALRWAETVLERNPGLPTIVTTHDYLSVTGERLPYPLIDLARVDPDFHNSAEQLWQKLISRHDQIFLVLSGHQHGQAHRVDNNRKGNPVYQLLADYQSRGQVAKDAGRKRPVGIGDGWLRLLRFDFTITPATLAVKTYSSHYAQYSSAMAQYSAWYRAREQPQMSAAEFYAADDFLLVLDGFEQRFAGGQ